MRMDTGVQRESSGQKMKSTEAVVKNHLKCFGEGDLEGILSDYAPAAVLFTTDGILRGREEIGRAHV